MRDLRCRDFNEVLLAEEEKRGGDLSEKSVTPLFSLNACGADDLLMFQSSSSSSSSSSFLFLGAFDLSKKKKK